MDSVDIEVLRSVEAWRRAGHRVKLGTIVKTWGSAPRPVGAMVAIRDDGLVSGSVSGGCVEDDLVEKVRAGAVAGEKPQLITYGVTNEEATRWGLPCGGTLQVVLEPVTEASGIQALLDPIGSLGLESEDFGDLTQADLRGANLFGAGLFRARIEGARFDLTNLSRTLLA